LINYIRLIRTFAIFRFWRNIKTVVLTFSLTRDLKMKPITLPGGEILIDNSSPEHAEEDSLEVTTNKRGNTIGTHKNCGNAFWLRKRTNDNVICCFGCLFFVEHVPSSVRNYKDLREWCEAEIARKNQYTGGEEKCGGILFDHGETHDGLLPIPKLVPKVVAR